MEAMELHKEMKALLKDWGADSKADSSRLWDFCKSVCERCDGEMAAMLASKKKEYQRASVRLTPEERAQELSDMLDEKLKNRELTASELREMKDIFNLKAKDQDILIQMMDFRAIDPKMADVVAAVGWQIESVNDTADNKA
jgi:hypothetical protein